MATKKNNTKTQMPSKNSHGYHLPNEKLTLVSDQAVADGSNQKFIAAILKSRDIARDADVNNIETLYSCLHRYLQYCFENNIKFGNMSVYSACGIDRTVVSLWESGKKRKSDPRYAEFARYIRQVCAEYREMLMSEGKLNPVTGIWWQKNYDGLSDNPTVIVTTTDDTPRLSGKEIAEKYKYLEAQNVTSEANHNDTPPSKKK